jgi:AcrR family transcriptional regulator
MPRLSGTRKALLTAMMKDAIVDAAVSVLREFGIGGTTMDRVATRAKLAKGSLYNYFENKGDLLCFVCGRIAEPTSKTIDAIVEADLPAPEKLEQILRTLSDDAVQHGGVLGWLLKNETIQDAPSMAERRRDALGQFSAVMEQGIREGTFRALDPAHAARMVLGCVRELFELQATAGRCDPAREYVELVIDVFLAGVSFRAGQDRGQPAGDKARVGQLAVTGQ